MENKPLSFENAEDAHSIQAGTVLLTKDGRKVNVISNNLSTYMVEIGGKQAEYPKLAILDAIASGRMTVEIK